MAKGSKKKKAGVKLQSAPVADAKKAAKPAEAPPYVRRVELAYDLGNHAAVRALAATPPTDQLDERALARVEEAFEKTKTDPLVLAIGAGALALALTVALATLGG